MIRIKGLKKRFSTRQGTVEAVKEINLEVGEREFCVLLGPSGCGKTTTLRCVAGLERPDAGEIEIGGTTVSSSSSKVFVPTERRDIGMVFQSYAIWPHMTVFKNVAFPLTDGRKRLSRKQTEEKVHQALRLVQLQGLEERPSTDLSGGQQQRVALARAIVTEPKVLLMDEPLSNLDARLRDEMRIELKKLSQELRVTTLYVTHDQAEALSLGDKICVMDQGRILQQGNPEEIYGAPHDLFVAQFVGQMNLIEGKAQHASTVQTSLGPLHCSLPAGVRAGDPVTVAIRPEHVELTDGPQQNENRISAVLVSRSYLGDSSLCELESGGTKILARLPGDVKIPFNQRLTALLPGSRCRVFSKDVP